MSPQLDVAFNWLPAIFGGRQSARSAHFILAFGFLFFVFGHVFMVLTQGFFNNMRSMITGSFREKVPSAPERITPADTHQTGYRQSAQRRDGTSSARNQNLC